MTLGLLRWPVTTVAGLATLLVVANLAVVASGLEDIEVFYGEPYVTLYSTPESAAEWLLNQGDGQAFAALSQDPTLSRPKTFVGGADSAAYRAQRPLLGWLVYLSTLGRSGFVPLMLFVWAVIGAAVLVAGIKSLAIGRERWEALSVLGLVLPGCMISLRWAGPDALATGLAFIGLSRWERDDTAGAIALLTLAALARETTLVLVVAMALAQRWHGREWNARLLALSVCPAVVFSWWVVIRWRLGSWPTDAGNGRLGPPFQGLLEAIDLWQASDVLVAAIAVFALYASWRIRASDGRASSDVLWFVIIGYISLGVLMGENVWARWEDFSRPLLPLYAAALILALPSSARAERLFGRYALRHG